MKATLILHIVMGALFIVPLILFNIRKIWVRKPPAPLKFKWGRCAFVVLFSAFIVVFLVCSYKSTLINRYEITIERLAEKHGEMLTGQITREEFRAFIVDNGTDTAPASFDATDFSDLPETDEAKFQFSNQLTPKYWTGKDAFDQTPAVNDENPIYLMYLMQADGKKANYVVRMRQTEDGWKYDWIGNATEGHTKAIKMPSLINGKWYTITAKQ